MKGFFKEFRDFAVKGNAVDMAVGMVIGAAFSGMVKSLVDDVFNPLLGILTFQHASFGALAITINGKVIHGDLFMNAVLHFLIVSFAIFIVIRQMNRVRIPFLSPEPAVPTTKACRFCYTTIAVKATRCPNCTSELGQDQATS